jgi:hypothetical protein
MDKNKKYYYTYIIRHKNGQYYVGRRTSKVEPQLDSYMGSGVWVTAIKDRDSIEKYIIAEYNYAIRTS